MRIVFIGIYLVAAGLAITSASAAERWTLQADVHGQTIEALPLDWSEQNIALLDRDGRLWNVKPTEVTNFRRVASDFQSYSAADLRGRLQRELGSRFEISGTGHFLVAHPLGQHDRWAERFEQLYRSFVHFASTRGFDLKQPEFPLVAIVWPTQADFLHYATSEGLPADPNLLGYYSLTTNRVTLYDMGDGRNGRDDWRQNAATIVHEASHQSAFNTGVHSRLAPPPRWVAEGLGTSFEARGVWESETYSAQTDRLNRGRLADFKALSPARIKPGSLAEFVSSDRAFGVDPPAAYAEAWALTFYLMETQPAQYAHYLAKTSARKPFTPYSGVERLADFTAAFGSDLRMVEAGFRRYMDDIK